jgi:quercetin dioxygenase-like cupin family protein
VVFATTAARSATGFGGLEELLAEAEPNWARAPHASREQGPGRAEAAGRGATWRAEDAMVDVTVKRVEELEFYQGERALPGIRFRYAARGLGVTAWGMNVIEMEPGCTRYPDHDHSKDGQEEVYTVLRGSATLHAADATWLLEPGVLVRVGPGQTRKIIAGAEGVLVLALGGTPGKAYEVRR